MKIKTSREIWKDEMNPLKEWVAVDDLLNVLDEILDLIPSKLKISDVRILDKIAEIKTKLSKEG